MAELEAELGVRATYYVMARSPFYNPFSREGRRAVHRITDLGHRLGTHCDLDAARDSRIEPTEAFGVACRDLGLLQTEFPKITRRLSFHCPPHGLVWREIPGFESAYAPRWEGRYRADSGGSFAYGDPEDAEARPLQVNLHAEHWFGDIPAAHRGFWR